MSEQEIYRWLDRWTAVTGAAQEVFPGELTLNQLVVLGTLGGLTRQDDYVPLARIVEASGLSRSTVSRALDAGHQLGYARWVVDPADARRRLWCLTPEGHALRPQLARAIKARWPQ